MTPEQYEYLAESIETIKELVSCLEIDEAMDEMDDLKAVLWTMVRLEK